MAVQFNSDTGCFEFISDEERRKIVNMINTDFHRKIEPLLGRISRDFTLGLSADRRGVLKYPGPGKGVVTTVYRKSKRGIQ